MEDQEHVLTCKQVSAHKQCYKILPTIKRKMMSTLGCKVQRLFVKCFEAWLENPDTQIIPDVSIIPEAQCKLLLIAIAEQDRIGWTLGLCGYLS